MYNDFLHKFGEIFLKGKVLYDVKDGIAILTVDNHL